LLTPTIISSFTSAAAIIIAISQLKLILGIEVVRSPQIYVIIQDIIQKLGDTHFQTVVVGFSSIVMLVLLKRFAPKIPRAFVVVGLSVLVVVLGDLGSSGVSLVGQVPQGLPNFTTPWMQWDIVLELLPHALVIALIAFIEAFSVASKVKHEDENIDASRELIALGGANIMSGLFQGYSVTGGLSRTAVNDSAGAKSQVASIITATVVVLTLWLFSNGLTNIPKPVLGAIIMTAVSSLISVQYAKDVFLKQKHEIPVYVSTFLATIFIGVKEGLFLGISVHLLQVYLLKNSNLETKEGKCE